VIRALPPAEYRNRGDEAARIDQFVDTHTLEMCEQYSWPGNIQPDLSGPLPGALPHG